MSVKPSFEPACSEVASTPVIQNVIDARARDLGGFSVRRLLPSTARRTVGPFIFFDHMGPAIFEAGAGIDVRPHPHIGLATVTYLFDGEIVHRDSLGSCQAIRPGDINWMTAGRGIAHSERTDPSRRQRASGLHGLQLWVALPTSHEETAPAFHHHPAASLPVLERDGAQLRVLAGTAYGATSPVETLSPLFYVDVVLPAGCELALPSGHEERAAYVVDGEIGCGAERATAGRMLVFAPGGSGVLCAEANARLVLIGGAPLDGPRHIFWNFVSSSPARIERAKQDWANGSFGTVPGDETEFIPLPQA
jgi:redox-sensitive bicupin YhaK (pirin superfamily)